MQVALNEATSCARDRVCILFSCHLLPHGVLSDKLFMKKKSQIKNSHLSEIVRQRLRRLRLERCFTQETLCDRAGISIDAVSRIEGGSRVPTLDTLEKLADALGVRVVDLVRTTELPTLKLSPNLQRIVNLLEGEPPAVQTAAEKVVKAILQAIKTGYSSLSVNAAADPPTDYREGP